MLDKKRMGGSLKPADFHLEEEIKDSKKNHMKKNNAIVACAASIVVLASMQSMSAAAESYVVQSGDCLTKIAAKYADETITVATIMEDNNLQSHHIEPGWVLEINSRNSGTGSSITNNNSVIECPIANLSSSTEVTFISQSWYLYTADGNMSQTGKYLTNGGRFVIKSYEGNDNYIISYNGEEYAIYLRPEMFKKHFKIASDSNTSQSTVVQQPVQQPNASITDGWLEIGTTASFTATSFCVYNPQNVSELIGYLENGDNIKILESRANNYYKVLVNNSYEVAIRLDKTNYNKYFTSGMTSTTPSVDNETQEQENPVEASKPVGISTLPESVVSVIKAVESQNPNCRVSAGVYSLDGSSGFTYNGNTQLYAGCSLKAAYAEFVLKECDRLGIDIDSKTITFTKELEHGGSGDIRFTYSYGDEISIRTLVFEKLIPISDNTAYMMLLSEFKMDDYKRWLDSFGGQQQIYSWQKYGSASANERKNEWVQLWRYINSGTRNAQLLKSALGYAQPNFFGVSAYHKSGSCSDAGYLCASDAGVIDNRYILVVIVQNANNGSACTQGVTRISTAIRSWVNSEGIY